ncbi:phytoene desaturase [Bacillus salacetis]|uniref:Phytoene desaturase n=1 Tax=Bacillus salacetis TaxID=2315464 RepID=A0A3A1R6V3_9BACI|nr:phytoene desaturase family protein [Bacillus salacetis]RIW38958.1 phytoene desaturase [Bacillus salacetis]
MRTAIIGGGVGGLTTALLLKQRGHDVTIFEKSSRLGGRLGFIERDGFKIDKGPTIVLLPDMLKEVLKDAGVNIDELDLIQCDPLYKLHYPDGSHFYKYSNLEKQLNEIERVYPGEQQNYLRYLKDMKHRFQKGKLAFLDKDFVKRADFFSMGNMKTLMELKAFHSVRKSTRAYFTHPRLQEAFSFQTLYIGGSPDNAPALYSLIPYSEHEHGIWYLKGGYGRLADILARHVKEAEIPIHLESEVTRLQFAGNRCTGLVLNGKQKNFDAVVFNGDFPGIHRLINNEKPRKKRYKASSGCLLLYFGLNRKYDEADVHQFFMPEHFQHHMDAVFSSSRLTENPSIYTFYPSKIDSSLAPAGKSVLYSLIPVPSGDKIDWKNQDDYIEGILEELEARGFPGLKEAVEWMEVRTPEDDQQDGLYQGGSFGIAPTLNQSGVFRPQVKPFSYEGLYSVGASVHPGGGIPIVMQGAKLLSNYMEREMTR